MDEQNTLGANLRSLRLRAGLSQQEVSDALSLTRQAYGNYERGKRTPDIRTLIRTADYFEVSLDELIRGMAR